MSEVMHPAAQQHLPPFITAPGETDVLFTGSVIFLILAVMGIGSLYFWLHSLPERMSHGAGQLQFQLVAVLSLLALFTHNTAFWIAALFLALIPVPDFWTPLASMADSLARMAMRWSRGPVAEAPQPTPEVLVNHKPVKVEVARLAEQKAVARNGQLDDFAKTSSDTHQRQIELVGGNER